MSDRFEENLRFVQEWVTTMKKLCPAEEVEDFEWVFDKLSEGISEWKAHQESDGDTGMGELPREQ